MMLTSSYRDRKSEAVSPSACNLNLTMIDLTIRKSIRKTTFYQLRLTKHPKQAQKLILASTSRINQSLLEISSLRRRGVGLSSLTIHLSKRWFQQICSLSAEASLYLNGISSCRSFRKSILAMKNYLKDCSFRDYDQIELAISNLTTSLCNCFVPSLTDQEPKPRKKRNQRRNRSLPTKFQNPQNRLSILPTNEASEVLDSPGKVSTQTNLAEQIQAAILKSGKISIQKEITLDNKF